MSKIRLIVVDDSALMRKLISDMINMENDMEAVCIAKNGEELLQKIPECNPDVITLDVEMPKMNGIEALKEIKKRNINVPVIMLSSVSKTAAKLTMDCLHYGAFDFVAKPSGSISLDIEKVKDELINKIRTAYSQNNSSNTKIIKRLFLKKKNINRNHINISKNKTSGIRRSSVDIRAIAIGASTGGPKALYKVITNLPGDLDVPVFLVQHMPVGFTKAFADRLNSKSQLKVVEAEDNMKIEKSTVYIAKGGFHMEVKRDGKIHLNDEPTMWGVRPAVDKLFKSAANVYGSNLLSVLLTGMGRDGADGTVEVKKNNGITFAEDESTCVIYGMPKAAYETGMVDYVIPLDDMAKNITKIVLGADK